MDYLPFWKKNLFKIQSLNAPNSTLTHSIVNPHPPSKFRKLSQPQHTMADNAQVKAEHERIFKSFDANGDGKISSAELGDALKTLGSVTSEEVKRMMAEIDTDGDGFISFQEFTEFASANSGLMKDVAKIF